MTYVTLSPTINVFCFTPVLSAVCVQCPVWLFCLVPCCSAVSSSSSVLGLLTIFRMTENSHTGDWQGKISLLGSNHSGVTLSTTNPPWNAVVRTRGHALSNCWLTVWITTQQYSGCFRRNLPYFRRTFFKTNLGRYNQTH